MDEGVRKFDWRPLLFLLVPLWCLVSGFFPGFQNAEYDLIAVEGDKPIGAGAVSLFKAYSYSSSFVQIFFYLGVISALLIGIYAVFASLFPLLRRFRVLSISMLVLLALFGTGYIAGGFLLANYVERFSIDYFASKGRIFDEFNALAFMNLNLMLSMAIPAVLFIWWVASCLTQRFRKD